MALIRWQPFREVEQLQRQMNRLFDEIMPNSEGTMSSGVSFMPAAEMHETHDTIQLRLEVPGLEAKDIDVQVSKEAVAIKGERKSEVKTEENGVTRSEFRYGSFQRVIPLPTRIQNEKVEAEYKNGVLTLNLPKAEEEKNRVVKVNLG
jgi:HSP20 family protein